MREKTTVARIQTLMEELGRAVKSRGRIYFTGGVSAVLYGWRETTLYVDLKADPEPQGFFEALPRLKDAVEINIELASPDQFVPALPGWSDRSVFIADHGLLSFYHYDFYGQALAKIERDHPRDGLDVQSMITAGLVKPARLLELFQEVEGLLIRYPAVDAANLRKQLEELTARNYGA
jgi:hypothetical protein